MEGLFWAWFCGMLEEPSARSDVLKTVTDTCFHVFLSDSHDQLEAISQTRHQVAVSVLARPSEVLETNTGNL